VHLGTETYIYFLNGAHDLGRTTGSKFRGGEKFFGGKITSAVVG